MTQMDLEKTKILEALKLQPLSKEEMEARHILGRLYGPIATCVESTRNGRLYDKTLWEKALQDEIFLEKVATKALFLELGHPPDREETDMSLACACIPEVPRIIGDDLYAYVDILDTDTGRTLKTLVDYGFVPGISSRGSGDVLGDNRVDPETFFLETWDIVQLPAVKKARLNVCESLDVDDLRLKKALAESYNAATDKEKTIMKKTLKNLNINIDSVLKESKKFLTAEDIPWDPDIEEPLTEEAEDLEDTDVVVDTEEVTEPEETIEEESTEEVEDISEMETVGDALEVLQEYDEDTKIEIVATNADGEEIPIENVEATEDEDTITLSVNCDTEIGTTDEDTETDEPDLSEEPAEEAIEEAETAEDNGDEEVIESLKDMVRQKEALETEIRDLRKAKSVGDAKEQELQEKLTRFRTAFKTTSAEAAKVPELKSEVQKLTEQLTQANNQVKELTQKVKTTQQLKESITANKADAAKLTENATKLAKQNTALKEQLEAQTKQYKTKLQERTDLAKSYKAKFIETLRGYIDSKASMLNVSASEITSRLNENYTLADVDAVCDQILNSTINYSRLPFSGRATARISESVNKPTKSEYDIDRSLLELAGLEGYKF